MPTARWPPRPIAVPRDADEQMDGEEPGYGNLQLFFVFGDTGKSKQTVIDVCPVASL